MVFFPVCDVLQDRTPVSGPADDRPSFSEKHFLLQYFIEDVPLCPALRQTPARCMYCVPSTPQLRASRMTTLTLIMGSRMLLLLLRTSSNVAKGCA